MLPKLGLSTVTKQTEVSVSPRGIIPLHDETPQNPLSARMENSFTSGQLMQSLSGGFMALGMKELKDDLRLSKRAEQLAKDKLIETKKQLEQTEEAFQKYKVDADARLENLKTENSMLQLSLKHMHEQNEAIERSSTQSNNNQDVFKIVEDYSKQIEQKSKEIEELLAVSNMKKTKHQQLKKVNSDLDQRLNRLQSKLDNMTKFCRIFIKSIKLQNNSLKDTVQTQQKDFSNVFKNLKTEIFDQIQSKFTQQKLQYEQLLAIERENVSNLKQQILKLDQSTSEKVKLTAQETQNSMQKEIELLKTKNDKLKQKMTSMKVSQSDADEQSQAHQVDVLNLNLANLKQKYELQLLEKDNLVQGLRETIQTLQSRENTLNSKLESVDSKSRQEYQRLIEMYEGSTRFREIRDLYEEKVNQRDQQLLETKQALVKCQVKLEYANESIETFKQKEQKNKQKLVDAENKFKSLQESASVAQKEHQEKAIQAQNAFNESAKVAQATFQQEFQRLSYAYDADLRTLQNKLQLEHQEDIQKAKLSISQELETQIKSDQQKLNSSQELLQKETEKVQELTQVLLTIQDAMKTIQDEWKLKEAQWQEKEEYLTQQLTTEQVKFQQQASSLVGENKQAELSQQKYKQDCDELLKNIEDLKQNHREEILALNWEIEDLRKKQSSQQNYSKKVQLQEVWIQTDGIEETNKVKPNTLSVGVEAIIINSSMEDSKQNEEKQITQQDIFTQEVKFVEKFKPAVQFGQMRPGMPTQPRAAPKRPVVQKTVMEQQQKLQPFPKSNQLQPQVFDTPKLEESVKTFEQVPAQITENTIETKLKDQQNVVETQKSQTVQNLPEESKQQATSNQIQQKDTKSDKETPAQTQEEAAPSRFYSIISSFMGLLSRRKQAYTGKPASAMYYSKEKNRWIIAGEEESEEDVPAPPPPKAKSTQQVEAKPEQKPEPAKSEPVGLNSLTQPVFGGALANRNRGKPKTANTGGPKLPSFPVNSTQSVVNAAQEKENLRQNTEEKLMDQYQHEQIQNSTEALTSNPNETELDISAYTARDYLSQTMLQTQESGNSEPIISKQQLLQTEAEIKAYRDRENDLKLKHSQQNEKIQSLKSQIQHLQNALQDEKQHSQQTIVELENFSNEMTEAGNHHQKQLIELTAELTNCQALINYLETSKWQVEESFKMSEDELDQTRQELRNLKQKCYSLEIQVQINEIQGQMQEDEKIVSSQTISRSAYDQLEDKCETLRWQLSIENQKVQKVEDYCRHLQSESQRFSVQLATFKTTNRDQQTKLQDLHEKVEREREINKESQLRFNQEKDQLQEQLRKQQIESQQHVRRLENEKQSKQQDFFKLMQEKDNQHQQSLEALESQKATEIQQLQNQLETQTAQQQNQLRLEQSRIKKQINSLESVLSKKDEDLLAVIGRNEEAQQELQTMSQMRHKLNDHIIYLQNEIRKRDELLEDGSDFEDDTGFADDSYCSNGQASSSQQEQASSKKKQYVAKQGASKHLEESRNQIKQLIEGKSQLSKEVSTLSQQVRSLNAGLKQILTLYDSDNNMSELSDSADITQLVIAKFFEVRNRNETLIMEMEQKIEHLTMQVDNASSLNFEVELLTGERDLLQNELNELCSIKDQLANELESTTANLNDQLNQRDQDMQAQDERHKRQISALEQNQARHNAEVQQNINEMRQKLAKRDDLINQLEQQVRSQKVDQDQYQNQIIELQKKVSSLNSQKAESINHYEIEIETLQASKIELENQVKTLKVNQAVHLKQISDLEDNVQEKNQQLTQSEQRLTALNNDFENVAQAFIQKKETYKQQIQKLKQQVADQQQDSQAVTELKAQLSQADSLIQQMQNETETIVRKMQDKKSQREQKLKERIAELTQENESFQQEIEKYQQQASQDQSSVLKEMQEDLKLKESSISELQKIISSHKIAYQALKCQQDDDLQKQQTHIKDLQEQINLLDSQVKQQQDQLKTAAAQTSDQSEFQNRQLNERITQLNNQIKDQASEIVKLQEQLDLANQNSVQIESQYQEESQKLADVFKQKQSQQREKSQQLKQELRDFIGKYTELENQSMNQAQRIDELSNELQHLQQEKLNLSQSLDLTKIQTYKEVSQMQIERKLIESELEQKLSLVNQQLTALVQQIDPELAQTLETVDQAIEIIHEWLKNAAEDKRSLQQLVQDKDEVIQENESLHYKIQILVQERDKIMQQFNLSENANLAKLVKTLEEEREELRNDFVIKMDSMSQENSILKEKLSMITKIEKETSQGDQSQQEKKSSTNQSTNYKLEQDSSTKPAPVKNTSFLASLFLTNSEL